MVPAMHATTASQMLFIRAPYRNTTPTPRMASRINSCTATAAVLPRNTPAGSRPESRRPSRAPSTDSTDTERWMASTVENRMATQNRPGAALAMGERSGPSAKANRTRAMTPKGATWLRATRERASILRSFPAMSRVSRHMDDALYARSRGGLGGQVTDRFDGRFSDGTDDPFAGHPATGDGHRPVSQ